MKSIKLVFLVALKQEVPECLMLSNNVACVSLKALFAHDYRVFEDSNISVLTIITGVGKKNSQRASTWVCEHLHPYHVINLGSAGSQRASLTIGQLVIVGSVDAHSYSPLACVDRVPHCVTNSKQLPLVSLGTVEFIGDVSPSDCVDMEAYWQAQLFNLHAIAFSSVKYITDFNDTASLKAISMQWPELRRAFEQFFSPLVQALGASINEPISVIIPTYNRADFIQRSVTSVLDQTVPCECIVVDDGSTDTTLDVLKTFDTNIVVVKNQKNQGVSFARNLGVLNSKSSWIAFLDSDDCWEPTKLEKQLHYYHHHSLFEIIQCDETWIYEGKLKEKKAYHQKKEGWLFDESLARCKISPSGVLMKRSLFDAYGGFNTDFEACEDYDLWCQIARDYPIGFNQDCGLTKYAGHHDQLSALPFLDAYRVQTLARLLAKEENISYQLKLQVFLAYKQRIIDLGRQKRTF
jgi:GT2 family glycosyltransferase